MQSAVNLTGEEPADQIVARRAVARLSEIVKGKEIAARKLFRLRDCVDWKINK